MNGVSDEILGCSYSAADERNQCSIPSRRRFALLTQTAARKKILFCVRCEIPTCQKFCRCLMRMRWPSQGMCPVAVWTLSISVNTALIPRIYALLVGFVIIEWKVMGEVLFQCLTGLVCLWSVRSALRISMTMPTTIAAPLHYLDELPCQGILVVWNSGLYREAKLETLGSKVRSQKPQNAGKTENSKCLYGTVSNNEQLKAKKTLRTKRFSDFVSCGKNM